MRQSERFFTEAYSNGFHYAMIKALGSDLIYRTKDDILKFGENIAPDLSAIKQGYQEGHYGEYNDDLKQAVTLEPLSPPTKRQKVRESRQELSLMWALGMMPLIFTVSRQSMKRM